MRNFSTKTDGKGFDECTIEAVWQKGTQEHNFRVIERTSVVRACKDRNTASKNNGDGKSIT